MPTTNEEARKVVSIAQEYLPLHRLVHLFSRLNLEVGRMSDNASVRDSLEMMHRLVRGAWENNQQSVQLKTADVTLPARAIEDDW